MTQRPLSIRSSISSLSSSSAISLAQIHPTNATNSTSIVPTQPGDNLSPSSALANPSQNPASTNSSSLLLANAAQPPVAVGATHTSQQSPPVLPSISNYGSTQSTATPQLSNIAAPTTPPPPPPTTSTPPPKQQLTRWARYFDDWWAWEISAGLLGITCLATIIIVLAVFDGKPQPEMRWGITLNALIALIVTVMKGALLTPLMEGMSQFKWIVFARETRPLMDFGVYDGASRGGFNALNLFWHMRKRFWREATALAALFYFLSFGVDTFAQQLIQTDYRDHNVTTNDPVTLARAQRYDEYSQLASSQGSIAPDGPDADMIAAIYTPLYATKLTDQSDLYNCPESNCTYPIISSLAVCGECHDLASKVITTSHVWGDVFSLPEGPEVATTVAMNVTSTTDRSRTNSFKDKVALIASFAYVNSTNTYVRVNDTWINDPPKAGECALFPCVQEYQTEVRRNVLNQTVLRQWSDVAPRRITDDTSLATGQWDYWYDIHVLAPGLEGDSAEIGFNMSITAFLGLRKAIPSLVQGVVLLGTSGTTQEGANASSPIIQRLFATTNMTELIERMASTMTSSIRRHGTTQIMIDLGNLFPDPENSLPPTFTMPIYHGNALRQLPFVQIVWPWIVLPAITVLFSNAFLVLAMVKTKQAQRTLNVGVWKSSSLPVLYHGLDVSAMGRANVNPAYSTSIAYMEENAHGLRVRLSAATGDIKLG